jgi:hypothetical protein
MLKRKDEYLFINPDRTGCICSYISFNEVADAYFDADGAEFNIENHVYTPDTLKPDEEGSVLAVNDVDNGKILYNFLRYRKNEYIPDFHGIDIHIAPYDSLYEHLKSVEGINIKKEKDLYKYLCAINDCGDAMEYIYKYFKRLYWSRHRYIMYKCKSHAADECELYARMEKVLGFYKSCIKINPSVYLLGFYYYFTIADVLVKNSIDEADKWMHSHIALLSCLNLAHILSYDLSYYSKEIYRASEEYGIDIDRGLARADVIYVLKCFDHTLEPNNVLFRNILDGFVKMVLE